MLLNNAKRSEKHFYKPFSLSQTTFTNREPLSQTTFTNREPLSKRTTFTNREPLSQRTTFTNSVLPLPLKNPKVTVFRWF